MCRGISFSLFLSILRNGCNRLTLMSFTAKEFYLKPSLHVSEIPPEIWIAILRHATWDSKFPFPSELTFESIVMSTSEHLQRYRKALVSSYTLLLIILHFMLLIDYEAQYCAGV